jgi:protein involved in polysaccharide export with SLBB domain
VTHGGSSQDHTRAAEQRGTARVLLVERGMHERENAPPPSWWTSLACAALLGCAACASHVPSAPPPGPSPRAGGGYALKPGDFIDIRFYKTPELNVEVPVRGDGKVSLEPVGDVQAAGLTPGELAHDLTTRYAKELTNPRVTVIVRGFGGQVFVGGEVKNPAVVTLTNGMTALQAIDAAGGFVNTGERSTVVLMRREDGRYRGHLLPLDKALSGEDTSVDVALEPGDIVDVPKSRIANADLFVEQYIRNLLPVQSIPFAF